MDYEKNIKKEHLIECFQNYDEDRSGSPILLKNSIQVIGIHRGGDFNKTENYGEFIGPIFEYFQKYL